MENRLDVADFMQLLSFSIQKDKKILPDSQKINWNFIYINSLKNDVLSIILPAIRFYAEQGTVPENLLRTVRKNSEILAYQEIKKEELAAKLLKRLKAENIDVAVLKGPSLKCLYPYPELRRMSDLDLLVIGSDICDVYNIAPNIGSIEVSQGNTHFTIQNILNVEVTDKLYPDGDNSLFGEERFNCGITAESLGDFSFAGDCFCSLAPDDNALYLTYHMFKHFIFGGVGLRQMCDFALFAKEFNDKINWSTVIKKAESVKMKLFLFALLKISNDYLNIDTSCALGEFESSALSDNDVYEILCDMINGGVFGTSTPEREAIRSLIYRRVVNKGNNGKSTFLKSVFPSYSYMKKNFKYVSYFPPLLPFSWIHRIVLFAFFKLFKIGKAVGISRITDSLNERLQIMEKLGI